EEGLRVLNARGLASRGYTVLQAGNGVEAIELLGRHGGEIDLIVSDVMMPEMDGPALFKEVRKHHPGIRIIFVSGYAEDASKKRRPAPRMNAPRPNPSTLRRRAARVRERWARPPLN